MRVLALVAATSLGLGAFAGVADAKTWTDPAGRVIFDTPNSWTLNDRSQPGLTHMIVGNANNECQIIAVPREVTAIATARNVRRSTSTLFPATSWVTVGNAVPDIFASQTTVISQTLETTQFWPIQRAELGAPEHPLVHGAIQARPATEIWVFCLTYGGADPVAVYDSVIRSVKTPQDAELQAQAEQQDTEHSAAQAAADAEGAAAAAAAEAAAQRRQHGRGSNTPPAGQVPPPSM